MDLGDLTGRVAALAKEVGGFIRQQALTFELKSVEYKGLNDLVSYVDKLAETLLVSELSLILPEAGFITEEKTVSKIGRTYNWVIDPLDGTTNFIHGIPTYSVSIALKSEEKLILGVVYEVNRDECFYAWDAGGAYLNGQAISVSRSASLSQSLLATGFPYYNFDRQEEYLKLFADIMQKCHGLRRIGSAAVDLAYVACGRFDGYFEYNLNDYDIAAGIVLVREAGGEVFDFSGGFNPIEKREVIATNGKISEELITSVKFYFNN